MGTPRLPSAAARRRAPETHGWSRWRLRYSAPLRRPTFIRAAGHPSEAHLRRRDRSGAPSRALRRRLLESSRVRPGRRATRARHSAGPRTATPLASPASAASSPTAASAGCRRPTPSSVHPSWESCASTPEIGSRPATWWRRSLRRRCVRQRRGRPTARSRSRAGGCVWSRAARKRERSKRSAPRWCGWRPSSRTPRSSSSAGRALHRDEVLSATELDAFALVADQRRALLDAGRDLLDAVAEVRPVDVELARAELDQAMVASERVRADYELTLVRSPIAGEVLAVNSRPGEVVGPDGIVEIGDLGHMIVVAEVYATDVGEGAARRAGADHRRVPRRADRRPGSEDRTRHPAQRDARSRSIRLRRSPGNRSRDRGRRR